MTTPEQFAERFAVDHPDLPAPVVDGNVVRFVIADMRVEVDFEVAS